MAKEGDEDVKLDASASEAGSEPKTSSLSAAKYTSTASDGAAESSVAAASKTETPSANVSDSEGDDADVTDRTKPDVADKSASDEAEEDLTSMSALGISDSGDMETRKIAGERVPELDTEDAEPVQQRAFAAHRRKDSVPPQRYDIGAMSRSAESDASGSSSASAVSQQRAGKSKQQYIKHDDDMGSIDMQRDMSMSSETEEAGLDFVDVSLGTAVQSPYGAGAQLGASRSALEIRKDSIASSDSAAARNQLSLDSMSDRASFSSESRDRGYDGEGGDLGETPKPRAVERMQISLDEELGQEARVRNVSAGSTGAVTPRSAEGRYRGRFSEPNSGTASPVLQSPGLPESLSNRSIFSYVEPASPAVLMTVVGDDGEIRAVPTSAISMDSPRGKRQELSDTSGEQAEDRFAAEGAGHEAKERNASDVPAEGELGNGTHDLQGDTAGVSAVLGHAEQAGKETTSPVLKDAADGDRDKVKDKDRRKSAGVPSAFEQHMSRTRMMTLPPKPKQEDVRHLNDFETIMKQSREMEQKRQQDETIRRIQRDIELQENMKIWESDILPSWTRARREGKLRKLWWKGIPPMLRGRLWAMTCGNNQMLPRNLFAKASEAVREGRKNGTFPQAAVDAILDDIEGTLPTLRLFQKDIGALHDDLFELLCAYTEYRLDQLRAKTAGSSNGESSTASERARNIYVPGTASLAAMLMINLAPSDALIALINVIAEKPWLSALYAVQGIGLDAGQTNGRSQQQQQHPAAGFERVFDTLLADQWPKVYANMQARGIRPSSYGSQWMRTLFVPYLPLETVARLWDCILLDEGDALLYRIGIALFSMLSARLYVPDKAELTSILRGNNRAAIAVWNRFRADRDVLTSPTLEKREEEYAPVEADGPVDDRDEKSSTAPRSPPTSPSATAPTRVAIGRRSSSLASTARAGIARRLSAAGIEAPDELVPRDDIYGGQYGITEAMLFRTLEEQDTWWKNSTLERLLDRELVS